MSDQKTENTALTVGEGRATDGQLAFRATVGELLQGMLDQANKQVMEEVVGVIEEASSPNRSSLPAITPDTARTEENGEIVEVNPAYGTRARLASPQSHLYARMDVDVQQWRNEESDFWMAEWLRGCYDAGARGVNRARQQAAEARLAQLFHYDHQEDVREHKAYERQMERADTLLGAAGANFALSAGTGGPLVPRPIEALLMIERDRVAKMRRFAQIYNMNRQQHEIPTAGSMTAGMTGEGATGSQGEPTFGAVPLVAKKGAVRAVASVEMLEDSAFNLVQIYATRAGAAFGVLEDDQFFKDGDGTGNNISARLAIGTVVSLPGTGTNELGYTQMLEIYYSVPQQYRTNAIWFAPSYVLQGLSGVRDAANGRPLYQGLADSPGPITDDPTAVGTIFRRPVYEVPLPDTADSAEIWFGDPRQAYAVGSRRGVTTTASEHVQFREDKIEWKFTMRFDGNNQDTGASAGANSIGDFNNA